MRANPVNFKGFGAKGMGYHPSPMAAPLRVYLTMHAQTSKYLFAYLHVHVPELFEPEMWPSHSPDLNPCNYGILGDLVVMV